MSLVYLVESQVGDLVANCRRQVPDLCLLQACNAQDSVSKQYCTVADSDLEKFSQQRNKL